MLGGIYLAQAHRLVSAKYMVLHKDLDIGRDVPEVDAMVGRYLEGASEQ